MNFVIACAAEEFQTPSLVDVSAVCDREEYLADSNENCADERGDDNEAGDETAEQEPTAPAPLPVDGGPLCTESAFCIGDPRGGEQWMKWVYFMAGPDIASMLLQHLARDESVVRGENRIWINALFTYTVWDGTREVPGERAFALEREKGTLSEVFHNGRGGERTLVGVHGWVTAQEFCSTVLGVGQSRYVSFQEMFFGPAKRHVNGEPIYSIPLRRDWVICSSTEPWWTLPSW